MLNWSLVVINSASAVAVAIVGAEYINPILLPASLQNNLGIKLTAVVVILILYALNYIGIKMGARVQNVLSMAKIILILLFCFAVFGKHNTMNVSTTIANDSGFNIIKAFGISLISVFFTYGGYQSTINFGADIQQPQKNIPRSIFTGTGIVIILYLTINFAYYSVLGFNGMQNSKLLAAELAKAFFGESGYAITCVVIFISVLGFINTSLMYNPRVYYAMADDKILPEIFKRVNSKTMTQEFSLSFFVALMLLSLFLLGTFEKIVNYVMFIDSISMASAAGTIFIFRKRAALREGNSDELPTNIFKIKLYPFVPLIFMAVLLIVTVNVVISDALSALYGFLIFLAGYPLYKLIKKAIDR
jgi:APA family basic amino acid/polyamine antiporter